MLTGSERGEGVPYTEHRGVSQTVKTITERKEGEEGDRGGNSPVLHRVIGTGHERRKSMPGCKHVSFAVLSTFHV